MWGKEVAYSVIIYDPVGIKFTALGATPELLNEWYTKVDFAPYILFPKGLLVRFVSYTFVNFFSQKKWGSMEEKTKKEQCDRELLPH